MLTQHNPLPTTNAPQEGFVLIVGLVILGLLTMLALSSMRDTTMQEKMAGASRDSGLAFQAAESALRDAENCITGTTAGCTFDAIDPPGEPTTLAGDPALNYIIRQASIVSGDAGGGKGADVGTRDYSKSKEKSSQAIYEITARGAGASGVGQSVLRVYYRK
jgi:type IV pilus assembly protein PilX